MCVKDRLSKKDHSVIETISNTSSESQQHCCGQPLARDSAITQWEDNLDYLHVFNIHLRKANISKLAMEGMRYGQAGFHIF
jgi:hypothetical protein